MASSDLKVNIQAFNQIGASLATAFAGMGAAAAKAADAFKGFGEALGQLELPELPKARMKPDATTWVMKDQNGQMVRVKVTEMTDAHLWRWIRYFRRKWRDSGFKGSDDLLDATIKNSIVTAPAIYAEAIKRGVFTASTPPAPSSAEHITTFLAEVKRFNPLILAGMKTVTFDADQNEVIVKVTHVNYDMMAGNQQWLLGIARRVWKRPGIGLIVHDLNPPSVEVTVDDVMPQTKKGKKQKAVTMSVDVTPGMRRITLEEDD